MNVTIFENNSRMKLIYADIDLVYNIIKNGNMDFKMFHRHVFPKKVYEENSLIRYDFKKVALKEYIEALRGGSIDIIKGCTYYYKKGQDKSPYKVDDTFYNGLIKFTNLDRYQILKQMLPAVVFNVTEYTGEMSEYKYHTTMEYIKKFSGYICLDFDKLEEFKVEELKQYMFNTFSFIKMIFISPSNKGLKIVCEYEDINQLLKSESVSTKRIVWQELNNQINGKILEDTGIDLKADKIDKNADDINRLCYLSVDENILFRKECQPFEFEQINYEDKIVTDIKDIDFIIQEKRQRMDLNKAEFPTDLNKELEYINKFIKWLKITNKRPFVDSGYNDVLMVGLGICDLFKRNNDYYTTGYDLFYQIVMLDSYYSNHKGEGENFIISRFDNYWNSPRESDNKISYGSLKYFINKKYLG